MVVYDFAIEIGKHGIFEVHKKTETFTVDSDFNEDRLVKEITRIIREHSKELKP